MGFPQSLKKLLRFVQRSLSPTAFLKTADHHHHQPEVTKKGVQFDKVIPSLNFSSESLESSFVVDSSCADQKEINQSSTQFEQQQQSCKQLSSTSSECNEEGVDVVDESTRSEEIVEYPLEVSSQSSPAPSSSSSSPPPPPSSSITTSGVYQMINFDGEIIDIVPTHHRSEPVDYSGHEFLFYQDLDARMQSFDCWPEDAAVSADKVAEAGFFYRGDFDFVRCYSCRGGLAEWAPEDDPWIEHARHYPNCEFLLMTKGPVFVDQYRQTPLCVDNSDINSSCGVAVQETTKGQVQSGILVSDSKQTPPPKPSAPQSTPEERTTTTTTTTSVVVRPNTLDLIDRRKTTGSTSSSISPDFSESESFVSSTCSSASSSPSLVTSCPDSADQLLICKICFESRINTVFVPCGHFCCDDCCTEVADCPMCRQHIDIKLRAYFT